MNPNNFSLIIPTLNSSHYLDHCLQAITHSSLNPREIIIVDGGSTDTTLKIASKYHARIIRQKKSQGRAAARDLGAKKATSDILVFLDSDNLVFHHTLKNLLASFKQHPTASAVVGIVSKSHPNTNFTSVYKNLYMHHKLSNLPEKITFLQGDIYAIKKTAFPKINSNTLADDTLRGHLMIGNEQTIILDKNVQVQHLKKYSLVSLLKNDFAIPFSWAQIFWKHSGWKQFSQIGGFAHATPAQLLSLLLAPAITLTALTTPISPISLTLLSVWFILNLDFFAFLYQEKGFVFAAKSIVFTFLDHHVMLAGILAGTYSFLSSIISR